MKPSECVSQMLEEGSSSMSLYNDIPFLKKVARYTPYVFIFIGGFIALLGGYIKIILGVIIASSGRYISDFVQLRITHLEDQKEKELKNTPPQLDVFLVQAEKASDFKVIFVFENTIPIKATWDLTTSGDLLVSPFFTEQVEIHPSEDNLRFNWKQTVNLENVVDGYLRLNFRYTSVYYHEMGSPIDLTGKITREYRLINGELHHLEETLDEGVQ